MANTTITALKTEISQLEKELEKHRRALQILEGGDRPQPKPAPAKSASAKSAPAKSVSAKSAPPPSIKGVILEVLRAKAPQKLTPSEIVQQLSQHGHGGKLHNIHARLSELIKAKTVKRQDGQYWIES
jgi:hypothetical protein